MVEVRELPIPSEIEKRTEITFDPALFRALTGFHPLNPVESLKFDELSKFLIPPKPDNPTIYYCHRWREYYESVRPDISPEDAAPILTLSITGITDRVMIVPATNRAIEQLKQKEKKGDTNITSISLLSAYRVETKQAFFQPLKDESGKIMKWQSVEKPVTVIFVSPEKLQTAADWSLIVNQIKAKEEKEVARTFLLHRLWRVQEAMTRLQYFEKIVARLEPESFEEKLQPTKNQLGEFKQLLKQATQQLAVWEVYSEAMLASETKAEYQQMKEALQKDAQKWVGLDKQGLALRFYSLGVKNEEIKRLLDVDLSKDQSLRLQRAEKQRQRITKNPRYKDRLLKRYFLWIKSAIFSPKREFYSTLQKLKGYYESLPLPVIKALSIRGIETLIEELDLPEIFKKQLEPDLAKGERLPQTVKEWLETKGLKKELDKRRKALQDIILKGERELDDQKRKTYKRYKERLANYLERNRPKKDTATHPLLPVLDGLTPHSLKLRLIFGLAHLESDIASLLISEFQQRAALAFYEQEVVEEVLAMQEHPRLRGKGYEGWRKEEKGKEEEFYGLLETAPSRIILDKELHCGGRQNLVWGVLSELGFDSLASLKAADHGFLGFEDALGIFRVVEPSGKLPDSYYPSNIELFSLTNLAKQSPDEIKEYEMKVQNQLERVLLTTDERMILLVNLYNLSSFLPSDSLMTQRLYELLGFLTQNKEERVSYDLARVYYERHYKETENIQKSLFYYLLSASLNWRFPFPFYWGFFEHFDVLFRGVKPEDYSRKEREKMTGWIDKIYKDLRNRRKQRVLQERAEELRSELDVKQILTNLKKLRKRMT